MVNQIQTNIQLDNKIEQIFHIADIHIPNDTDRHPEFRLVFENLYKTISSNKTQNSIIVIAGDIIDKSSRMTPDCIQLVKDFLGSLSKITDTIVISGNHDDNIRGNTTKTDSLSAIISDSNYNRLYHFRNTGIYNVGNNLSFGVTSVFDESLILSSDFNNINRLKIGLYHGMVQSTNNNQNIPNGNYKFTQHNFDGYDIVMLGDIHKHQHISKTIAYCGSLLQLNHGEDITNHGGCLEWNLNDLTSKFHFIPNKYGYITVSYINKQFKIPDIIPSKARVRLNIMDDNENNPNKIIEELQNKLTNCEIIDHRIQYINNNNINQSIDNYINNKALFIEYLTQKHHLSLEECEEIYTIHQEYSKNMDDNKQYSKQYWKPIYIEFENILCYSKKKSFNFLDKSNISNLWCMVGKNAQGKTSFVKVIIFALFGRIPNLVKDDLYNKKIKSKDIKTTIKFQINSDTYTIKRTISSVKLFKNSNNITESKKNDTETIISKLIGNDETIINTNISLQSYHNNFIQSKNSECLKIIKTILSLDIYDSIYSIIKEKTKQLQQDLKYITNTINSQNKIIESKDKIEKELLDLNIDKEELYKQNANNNKKKSFQLLIKNINKIDKDINKYKTKNIEYSNIIEFNCSETFQNEINNNNKKIKQIRNEITSLNRKYTQPPTNNITVEELNISITKNEMETKIKNKIMKKIKKQEKEIDSKINETLDSISNIPEKHRDTEIPSRYKLYKQKQLQLSQFEKTLLDIVKQLESNNKILKNHPCKYNNECSECCFNKNNDTILKAAESRIEILNNEKITTETKIEELNIINIEEDNSNYNKYVELNKIIEKQTSKLETLHSKYNNLDLSKKGMEIKRNNLLSQLKESNEYDTIISNNNIIDSKIKELENEITLLNNKNKENGKKMNDLNIAEQTLSTNTIKIKELETELNNINVDITELNYNKSLTYKSGNIDFIIKQIGKLETNLNDIIEIEREIETNITKEINIKNTLNNYSIYEKTTNWKGLPLWTIHRKIEILKTNINKLLAMSSTKFTCDIEIIDNDKKGADIRFYKIEKTSKIPIINCSGFEKFILSIAIRIGLIHISNYMTPNFMIIDEGFGTMDKKNMKNIGDMFHSDKLKNMFDIILLITHKEELKEIIPNHIEIANYNLV